MQLRNTLTVLALGVASLSLHAEDGSAAWLRYAPIPNAARYANVPSRIVVVGNSPSDRVAAAELVRGLSSMLGRTFTTEPAQTLTENRDAIVVGTDVALQGLSILEPGSRPIQGETYRIT